MAARLEQQIREAMGLPVMAEAKSDGARAGGSKSEDAKKGNGEEAKAPAGRERKGAKTKETVA
jgi:hypothetical protein